MRMQIADIQIGKRYRKDLGDIDGLAESVAAVGLLHPPVVTPDGWLVAGQRRLEAAKLLGWTHIEVNAAGNLADARLALLAQRSENGDRKAFTPEEDYQIQQDWLEVERVAAKARQRDHGGTAPGRPQDTPPKLGGVKNRGSIASELSAAATGRSHETLRKVGEVLHAAAQDPTLAHLREQMNASGKVDGAYRKLQQAKAQKAVREAAQVAPVRAAIRSADAITLLSSLEAASVDLLLTDPPYSTDVEDIAAFVESWVPAALTTLKPTARAYVCVGAYPAELHAYLTVLLQQQAFTLANVLVWTYRNTLGPSPKLDYKLNWQAVLYLRGPEAPPLDCPFMLEQFSVQDISAPDGRQGDRCHAWQKPDELAERFVRHASRPGDLVVDPFAGTGTFLLAAAKLGRRALGCDQDPAMVSLAVERGCVGAV